MKFSFQNKLGAWALIALVLTAAVPTVGCNSQSIAQQIVTWTPTIVSAADVVAQSVAVLDPQDAAVVAGSVAGFNAGANLISTQAAAYLASPSQNTLQALQTQVTTFQQTVNTAILQAARIVNPNSQQKLLLEIQAVAVGVNAVLALIISIKGSTAAPASATTIKISQIVPYMDRQLTVQMVAKHYRESELTALARVAYADNVLVQAGF